MLLCISCIITTLLTSYCYSCITTIYRFVTDTSLQVHSKVETVPYTHILCHALHTKQSKQMSTSSQLTTHAYLTVQKSLSSGLDSVQSVVSHFFVSYQTANFSSQGRQTCPLHYSQTLCASSGCEIRGLYLM